MRSVFTGAFLVIALSTAAFSQQAPSPASPPPSQPPTAGAAQGSQAGQPVTVTGCIQREADYRRAQDVGRGGVAGTGVGAGNEFVLAQAAMAGTAERAAGAPSTGATPSATGTTGTSTMAYELTGPNEGKVAQFVGRRVEITGQLKPAEVSGTGPTGGPTAGAPPRGVDVVSKDLQLRELEITSVREASGTCAAAPAK